MSKGRVKLILRTCLGVAQYRAGRYTEVVSTLTRADELNKARPKSPRPEDLPFLPIKPQRPGEAGSSPADLAFLVMAHYRLGQKVKAEDYLNRLRETMKKTQWAMDVEGQGFLREAEAL